MKLTSLKGSECLPSKSRMYNFVSDIRMAKHEERNEIVSQLEQVELCVDEEELTRELFNAFIIDGTWKNLSTWDKYRMAKDYKKSRPYKLAKSLSQSKEKWLKLEVEK